MARRGDNANPGREPPSPARQLLKVGMTAGILSGTTAALVVADQPAGAAGTSAAGGASGVASPAPTMADLASAVPKLSLVPLSPGQTRSTADLAWVENELATPGLSNQERTFLERDVPVAVTETASIGPPPSGSAVAGAAGSEVAGAAESDPVMSDSCTWTDLAGITTMWYHSYWGFSDNGSKVTQLSTPNDYAYSNGLLEFYFTGSTWDTSQPGPPTPSMSAQDDGYFDSQVLGYTVGTYEAEINYQLYGSGAWSTNGSSCSG
jgi:hypothetical protein